ncbi:hypothetical protein [Larkinella rosea]|uniref:Uncharacterized protein n=1 Tax=Larkinella rosea TaxID=2025312 RepID=A0A3P1B977_9BACT|nr:hypothetical protein [Larkinella rosea]RRA97666.1 hypothetical protein EHT25_31980 [Larkinella rosea]
MICQTARWLLLFSVLLLTKPAFAQLDADYRKKLDQAAFQMIKATAEFLATDKQTFPEVQTAQCTCDEYAGLNEFIAKNKLVGADKLVEDARRRAAQNFAQINQPRTALDEIKTYLVQKVASGDRASRQQLPGYKAYETTLTDLVNAAVTPGTTPTATVQPAETPEPTTPADTAEKTPTPTTSTTQSNGISMDSFALILSILSLAGVAFLAYVVLKDRKPEQSARDVQFDSQLAKLNDRISKLEVRKNQTNETFHLNSQLEALERAVRQLEQNRAEKSGAPVAKVPLEVIVPMQEAPGEAEVPTRPANRFRPTPVLPTKPTAFYARTADLGDGFSAGGLLTTPERDTVFDINLQNETQATYQVSENADAQRLALSDPYSYLNDACEYLTQPNPNSRIRTEQLGRLTLQGDKWKITEKAKIRFI